MGNGEKRKWLKAFPIDIERLYEKVDEPLPNSAKRWWWCWGGIVGLLFLLQMVTGLLLAFYYRADPQTAYSTVNFITEHARYGQFVRSVHQWGSSFMIVFLFLHMLRVFVVGAFREYRWGSWMVGVCLFAITLGLCFTGYSLVWSGQYEYMERVAARMKILIPLTVLIIFFLLNVHFRNVGLTMLLMLPLPLALVGGVWLMYILGFNLSVAVAVGMIAMAGIAAETGVVMVVYLEEAFYRFRREGRMKSRDQLKEAIREGAVDRVRPKLMTVMTTLIALLPIMIGTGTGSEVMKRIAAPMVGGLVTSALLVLIVIPAIYYYLKRSSISKTVLN